MILLLDGASLLPVFSGRLFLHTLLKASPLEFILVLIPS